MVILPKKRMQYFDVEAKTWKTLPVASPRIGATCGFCAVSLGDKLMIAAPDSLGNCIYRYDTDTHSGNNTTDLCVTDE